MSPIVKRSLGTAGASTIESPVAQMYALRCAKYADCSRFTQFQGHNHISRVMSINSADGSMGEAASAFIRDVLEGQSAELH